MRSRSIALFCAVQEELCPCVLAAGQATAAAKQRRQKLVSEDQVLLPGDT